MAKETITKLIDDLDGGEANETVKFALDDHSYEIDLSSRNAGRLRHALSPYLERATRVSERGPSSIRTGVSRSGGASVTERDQVQAIRTWALRKGLDVAPRGRIKQEIVEQYHREAGR